MSRLRRTRAPPTTRRQRGSKASVGRGPTLADSADNEAAQAYGVSGFPFIVVVGEDGTVKGRFSGEMGLDDLDQAVREALGTPA